MLEEWSKTDHRIGARGNHLLMVCVYDPVCVFVSVVGFNIVDVGPRASLQTLDLSGNFV